MTVEEKALAYYEKIINECFKITKECEDFIIKYLKSKSLIK